MKCNYCGNTLKHDDKLMQLESWDFGEHHKNMFCNIDHMVLHVLINRYGMDVSAAERLIPNY